MSFTATVADQNRWQRQALTAMTAVITKGARAGLPPLMWQLGAAGCHGSVSTMKLTVDEQAERLRAWARALGWDVVEVGAVLRAQEPVRESWMSPRVVISVKLFDWEDGAALDA